MRSQGQVRFITITSRVQIVAASLVAAVLAGWVLSMAAVAITQYQTSSERAELLDREARVSSTAHSVAEFREQLAAQTADLEKRQDFIESALELLPDDMTEEEGTLVPDADTAPTAPERLSLSEDPTDGSLPEAAGLARLEARQLAFVDQLTRYADRRAARTEQAIRSLGLDPRMVMVADEQALGGPLEMLASDADGSLDPRFERLALSLSRMSALERGLNEIPQVMPADIRNISSGFGYRRDPFNGRAAMHSGLDFRGPYGAPILAAADGRVSFVGNKSGYGRVVEISHGNGMMTRYAHMSRQTARAGQEVAAGDEIGKIGSSGRSTGAHLHFEVRINGRAVNPRPFLETAPDVLEEARAEFVHSDTAAHGQ